MGDVGMADEIKAQMELLEFYAKKRQQEEEDIRLARELETQNTTTSSSSNSNTSSPVIIQKEEPKEDKMSLDENISDEEFARRLQEELNKSEADTTPQHTEKKRKLTDSDFARQLQEENSSEPKMMGSLDLTIDADRDLAQKLWEEEQASKTGKSLESEWDRELASLKAAAELEAQEKIEQTRKEKETIELELQKIEWEKLKKEKQLEIKTFQGVEFPAHWEPQKTDLQIFNVHPGSKEWNRIIDRFKVTAPGTHIKKIERNQNRTQWTFYFLRREQISLKNGKNPNEMMLYHGSRNSAYTIILTEGFDYRVANMGGAIGAGTYFATHASYSKNYTTENKMLYCRVAVGNHGKGKSGIRLPPKGTDSVANVHSGNGMYVVFDNHQCYPEYMLYY
eukprot:TRINITY_DN6784_c0_g1_i1.p1 TRINITY_DN6784_c0_g1~~TRINITY_DN6784_c0_g1_i1.p1  ORF type:complete len:394 (-),score=111.76 TRINITY_DN6784_c0_g1_i1:102-1283(-)